MALPEDKQLIARLLNKDERAFTALVNHYHPQFLRVARAYVSSDAVAEEVVQESWLGVLKSLPRFEGRSSLKTWLFRILTNRAKTRGVREGRSVPFSSLGREGDSPLPPDSFDDKGQWAVSLQTWKGHLPDNLVEDKETREELEKAIAELPSNQRIVITLRDVQGCSSAEVCAVLEVSEANQRVLLHRARGRVRKSIHEYLQARLPSNTQNIRATTIADNASRSQP